MRFSCDRGNTVYPFGKPVQLPLVGDLVIAIYFLWRFVFTAAAANAVYIVVWKVSLRIAVVCGAGGGLVYLVAAQHGEGLRACPGQGLPPHSVGAPILQQERHLAAGKLFCRFGGDFFVGTVGTVGKVVTVGVVARTVIKFVGSAAVHIVTVMNV